MNETLLEMVKEWNKHDPSSCYPLTEKGDRWEIKSDRGQFPLIDELDILQLDLVNFTCHDLIKLQRAVQNAILSQGWTLVLAAEGEIYQVIILNKGQFRLLAEASEHQLVVASFNAALFNAYIKALKTCAKEKVV
jgi:hypothetical protein